MKPRVLFVGRSRYRLPLSPTLAQKFGALRRELDVRVLASSADGRGGDETFRLIRARSGAAFWLTLPVRVARELRAFRPAAVITQSPYEAAAVLLARRLAGVDARLITDVQGDWRTATRLYGSPARAVLRPAADGVAAAALRRVDAVRTISPFTTRLVRELGIEPAGSYPTFVDLDAFTSRPPVAPPAAPVALFVGVLEPYKNIDGLAAAWPEVVARVPDARLHVVGKGSRAAAVEELAAREPSVEWTRQLDAHGVASALDAATLLVLPSRSEGMGRVVIEAFARARPVVGTRVGGIADLVEAGVNGLLVPPGDRDALVRALVELLADRDRAAGLGRIARSGVEPWLQTPEEFAARTRALVEAPR
jgi:glycosyltransferase involved in cell wall biosynthesis